VAVALLLATVAPVHAQNQTPAPQQPAAPAATGGHAAPQYTGPLPPLRVEPSEANFGIANPDHPIHLTVKVTNTSPKSIRISEVRPTCKCTVPTLPKNILTPGEEIEIAVVLDLRGSLGDVRKPFDIFVDGWNRPWTVVVTGKLQYPILITPDQPKAVPARRGEITLTSAEGRPFKVISVHGLPPQVVEKEPKEGPLATKWTIQWDVTNIKDWPYMLVVETDHPGCEVFTVRLYGGEISAPEMPFIKNWKQVFCNRVPVNLGTIPSGGSVDVEVPMTRAKHDCDWGISFQEDRIETTHPDGLRVELVDVKPIDGKPSDELCIVRVFNTSEVKKTVCVPLYFSTKNDDPEALKNEVGGAVRTPGEFLARCWLGGVLQGPNPAS